MKGDRQGWYKSLPFLPVVKVAVISARIARWQKYEGIAQKIIAIRNLTLLSCQTNANSHKTSDLKCCVTGGCVFMSIYSLFFSRVSLGGCRSNFQWLVNAHLFMVLLDIFIKTFHGELRFRIRKINPLSSPSQNQKQNICIHLLSKWHRHLPNCPKETPRSSPDSHFPAVRVSQHSVSSACCFALPNLSRVLALPSIPATLVWRCQSGTETLNVSPCSQSPHLRPFILVLPQQWF